MQTSATHQIGIDLHQLLRDLEPTRWKDERVDELRAGLADIQQRLNAVLREWETGTAASGEELLEPIRDVAHRLESSLRALPDTNVRETWMTFRDTVSPVYSALAEALKPCHLELPDLRPTNWMRSATHAASGVGAVLLLQLLPFEWVEVVAVGFAIFAWTLETLRRLSDEWNARMMKFFSRIAHPHEAYRVNSSTWYATALVVLVSTGSPVVCAVSVMILAICDPIAAIVGRKFGTHKLVNNRSLEGTTAFFVSGMLITWGTISLLYSADVNAAEFWAIVVAAPLVGALTELFSRRIDDNFGIPVASAMAAWLMLSLF